MHACALHLQVDLVFATFSLAFMIAFVLEVLLRSFAERPPMASDKYVLSFFFWLDLIASLSMAFEALPVFQVAPYRQAPAAHEPKSNPAH